MASVNSALGWQLSNSYMEAGLDGHYEHRERRMSTVMVQLKGVVAHMLSASAAGSRISCVFRSFHPLL